MKTMKIKKWLVACIGGALALALLFLGLFIHANASALPLTQLSEKTYGCFGLQDDGFYSMFMDYEAGQVVYSKQSLHEDKKNEVATLTDFYIGTATYACVNDSIYFWYGAKLNEQELYPVLCEINTVDGSFSRLANYPEDSPIAYAGAHGDLVVSNRTKGEGDIVNFFVELYDPATGETTIVTERTLDNQTRVGESIGWACSDGEQLYVFVWVYVNGQREPFIEVYSSALDLVDTFSFSQEAAFIAETGIKGMHVENGCLYMINYSSQTLIGLINDGVVDVLLADESIYMASSHNTDGRCLLFEKEGNTLYLLDTDARTLTPFPVQLRGDYTLSQASVNKTNAVLTLSSPTKGYAFTTISLDDPKIFTHK